jgi:histone H2A
MEFLCAELLEVSGYECKHAKKRIIKPTHIELAVRNDSEFKRFFQNHTFTSAGKVPFILPCL